MLIEAALRSIRMHTGVNNQKILNLPIGFSASFKWAGVLPLHLSRYSALALGLLRAEVIVQA